MPATHGEATDVAYHDEVGDSALYHPVFQGGRRASGEALVWLRGGSRREFGSFGQYAILLFFFLRADEHRYEAEVTGRRRDGGGRRGV